MKKNSLTGLLVVGTWMAGANFVMGQGLIQFSNYGSTTDARVVWWSNLIGRHGVGVDSSFTAGLYYALGTVTWYDPARHPWPESSGMGDPSHHGFTLLPVTATFNSGPLAGPAGAGYFLGGVVTIPDYTGGPITFVVSAYAGGAIYAVASVRTHSEPFTLPFIATGPGPAAEFGPQFAGFYMHFLSEPVPEPSGFVLAGLGLAGLLLLRPRK